jgi:hypothetical protein
LFLDNKYYLCGNIRVKEYLSIKDENDKKGIKEYLDPFGSDWIN